METTNNSNSSHENNSALNQFLGISWMSPAAFVLALLGFFLTFTEINCNGQKIASITGMQMVTGTTLANSYDSAEGEKTDPNVWAIIALVCAAGGVGLIFYKKVKNPKMLSAALAAIGLISMIILFVDVKSDINKSMNDGKKQPQADENYQDPFGGSSSSNSLFSDTDLDMQLKAEMKFGYWLVTFCFLITAVWNYLNTKKQSVVQATADANSTIPPPDAPGV